jgi:uncharacterized membrane protein
LAKSKQNTSVSIRRAELYAGPLPHPTMLEKFEQILPGSADRILKQAEAQTQHRILMESKVVSADIIKSYMGISFGFMLGLSGIGGGIYLATLGFDVFGPILSSGSLVTLVGAFIYGTRSRKQEREKRFDKISR